MATKMIKVVFVHNEHATMLQIESGRLPAMQALVGGLIERVSDFAYPRNSCGTGRAIDVFGNEEACFLWPDQDAIEEPISGMRILGPYFYIGHDDEGRSIGLTDQQVAYILGAHS